MQTPPADDNARLAIYHFGVIDRPQDNDPDPMPEPTPDQVAMGLRRGFRMIVGLILLAAMLTVVIRGIYVAWKVSQGDGG